MDLPKVLCPVDTPEYTISESAPDASSKKLKQDHTLETPRSPAILAVRTLDGEPQILIDWRNVVAWEDLKVFLEFANLLKTYRDRISENEKEVLTSEDYEDYKNAHMAVVEAVSKRPGQHNIRRSTFSPTASFIHFDPEDPEDLENYEEDQVDYTYPELGSDSDDLGTDFRDTEEAEAVRILGAAHRVNVRSVSR